MNEKKQFSKKFKEEIYNLFNNKCYFCSKDLKEAEFADKHIHHLIPESMGGATDQSNLVLSCYRCHSIMHRKVQVTYNELRRLMYRNFCSLLEIIPCTSWDDDLESAKEEMKINPKEVPENWRKLIYVMRWMDNQIGKIDNGFKVKEALSLDAIGSIMLNMIKNKDLDFYSNMEKNFDKVMGEQKNLTNNEKTNNNTTSK